MKYVKPTLLLTLGISLIACGPSDPQQQIEDYRKKIIRIEQKIAEIEQSVDQDSVSGGPGQQMAVEVLELVPERFSRHSEVTGLMEAVQDAEISPEISGQIEEIAVNRGERVSAGRVLVRLNTELIEKNIAEVKTNLELAARLFEKQEELWEKQIGSEIQYLEAKNGKEVLEARLETLQKQLAMATVTAPFSGIVERISVREGELASPGMPMLRLVNLERMRVTSRVSESYLNQLEEGDEVVLRFDAYPEMMLREKISRMGQVIDPQTRTLTLEIELRNRDNRLKPNMIAAIQIEDYRKDSALVVPSIVLRDDINGTFLYRAVSGSEGLVADKVYVTRGATVQDRTEITGGVSAGDRVIVKGYQLVGEGTPVIISKG